MDSSEVSAIKEIIAEQGPNSIDPILVRIEKNIAYVVDGHHRLEAFKSLGYDRVPIHYVHAEELGREGVHGFLRSLEELLAGFGLCD